MTTAAEPAATRPAPSPWFRSAAFDLPFLLCVPLLTWPLVMAGQDTLGSGLVNQLILLTATGHYFATFVRTYGDEELFKRFPARFILAPIVLLVTCVGMTVSGHGPALFIVTAAWAFWHWLAQAFGFARIYDIKIGSYGRLTALLDKALVIVGFVGAVTLNDGGTVEFAKLAQAAGIPLPSGAQFAVIEWLVLGAMVVVGAAYLVNLGVTIARGQPWSWQKQFMHVTTIGYYWFAFAYLPNVLVAYVLYELFHDIQYYAITWITCRGRVARPGVKPWMQRMFRPGWMGTLLFLAAMTSFGGLDALGRANLTEGGTGHSIWLGVFITFALLHYYYDGFIWKARETTLGGDLGISGGLRAAVVPEARHAAAWAVFFVPMAAIALLGKPEPNQRARLEALVALAPGDFFSQAELGLELAKARELDAAIRHYRKAITLNPDQSQIRANFGAALDLHGDLEGAREQYEAALRCPDHNDAHARAHLNLAVLSLVQGDDAAARPHREAARALGAGPPLDRILGLATALPEAALTRRAQLLRAALRLDPNHLLARFQLGEVLLAQRQFPRAAEHFRILEQKAPHVSHGIVGLATALTEMRKLPEARAALQRALRIAPKDPKALALKARLGL